MRRSGRGATTGRVTRVATTLLRSLLIFTSSFALLSISETCDVEGSRIIVGVVTDISPRDPDAAARARRLRAWCAGSEKRKCSIHTHPVDDAVRERAWSHVLALRRLQPFVDWVYYVDPVRGNEEGALRLLETLRPASDDALVVRPLDETNEEEGFLVRGRSSTGRKFLDMWWDIGGERGFARAMRRRGALRDAREEVRVSFRLAALRWMSEKDRRDDGCDLPWTSCAYVDRMLDFERCWRSIVTKSETRCVRAKRLIATYAPLREGPPDPSTKYTRIDDDDENRPFVVEPRDGEYVSAQEMSVVVLADASDRRAICASVEGWPAYACASLGVVSTVATTTTTSSRHLLPTLLVLHRFDACETCGTNVCAERFALNVPDVESSSSRTLSRILGRPESRFRLQIGIPVEDWGCHRLNTCVAYVRNSESGVIYCTAEKGTTKTKQEKDRDDHARRYRNCTFRLADVAPHGSASDFYGRRRLRFWFEGADKDDASVVHAHLGPLRHLSAPLLSLRTNEALRDVAICVLVSRGSVSFRRAFRSWVRAGLLTDPRISRVHVYLQEYSADSVDPRVDDELAASGAEILGTSAQVGIAAAFAHLVQHAEADVVLFLEEDFRIATGQNASERLSEALALLRDETADVVRLRSRSDPGDPDCYRVLFEDRQELLPAEAHLSAVTWANVSSVRGLERCGANATCASSAFAEWTNNPFMASRRWLERVVVPVANADAKVFGSRANLEIPMRKVESLWRRRAWRVAQTEGLFTHEDTDKPLEEQSWPCGMLLVEKRRARREP